MESCSAAEHLRRNLLSGEPCNDGRRHRPRAFPARGIASFDTFVKEKRGVETFCHFCRGTTGPLGDRRSGLLTRGPIARGVREVVNRPADDADCVETAFGVQPWIDRCVALVEVGVLLDGRQSVETLNAASSRNLGTRESACLQIFGHDFTIGSAPLRSSARCGYHWV